MTLLVDYWATSPVFNAIADDTGFRATDGITQDQRLLLLGMAPANATVEVTRTDAGVVGTANADSYGRWTFNYTGTVLADGTYQFTAKATDLSGNVGPTSPALNVTVDTTAPSTTNDANP